jgi:hypothetical protein
MTARTPDGQPIELDDAALDGLAATVRGTLLRFGDPGYDESRTVWNAMFDRHPAFVLRALGVSDVIAFVNFVRDRGLAFSIKGGGHNVAGLATTDGGAMLDMSRMRGVWVDPAAKIARVQPGCLLGDVDRETQVHGLAAVLGFVSETGVAGLTLGGGFGYLTRKYGWTCDTLVSVDLVTADGRVVHASANENADLFWGVRGGGGNFGIAIGFEFRLYPVGPGIVGGAMAWPAHEAPAVLDVFREVMHDAPPELTCVAALRKAPPAPWLDPAIHGKDIVLALVCHTGSMGDGEKTVARFRQIGSPAGDVMTRRSYVSQQSLLDPTQPKGRRYYWKSEYLASFQPDMLTAAISHAHESPSPHSAILLFPLDGALNTRSADTSPAGNRDAKGLFNVASSWDSPADDNRNIAWTRDAWSGLRLFSTGGTYLNFLSDDDDASRTEAAYGDHVSRLAQIKATWDSHNLFRTNRNIAPTA